MRIRARHMRAPSDFAAWCETHGIRDVRQVQPVHVAAFIEGLKLAPPSISQKLAALRMLFDWLVVGQVLSSNPAASVRGPRFSAKEGKTPVLSASEVRALFGSMDITTETGLRDRALLALMLYTFARVGATTAMRVNDVYNLDKRTWVRLRKAASATRCPATRSSLNTFAPTSNGLGPAVPRAGCSVPASGKAPPCQTGRCSRPTSTG